MSKAEDNSPKVEWESIDWRKVEHKVFKLQKRIYRASLQGSNKLTHKLQKTMVNSWYGKLLAVRRISQENKGKNTAGVDGIKKLSPKARVVLTENLRINGKAHPTRRVWIPKPGKKEMRPLGIPTMEDRAKQTLLKQALEPEWEAKFEPNSYGFRPGRSCHDAIRAIHDSINKKPKYVLDADIAKCFDQIDHKKLIEKIKTKPLFKRQIKAWLKCGVIDFSKWAERKGLNETSQGTPQGGAISPLLANIALHGLENLITNNFPPTQDGYIKKAKSIYGINKIANPRIIRYADDFVVLTDSLTVIQECQVLISQWLKTIGLELKPSKTRIAHTLNKLGREKPGFNFLGFKIQQFNVGKHHSGKHSHGKLLGFKTIIKPSPEKVKNHLNNITRIIDNYKSNKQIALISKLTPVIRGWCNYQTPWNSKRTFSTINHIMWKKLWKWARSRHPNKGKKWICKKYFHSIKGDNWIFSTRENNNPYSLIQHNQFPAGIRWIKVKSTRTPYDGDEIYWSRRIGDRYLTTDPQKSRLIKKQKGKCTYCGLTFKPEDRLEKHHIIPKNKGGNNSDKNLSLIHLHCHDLIHST